MLFCSCSSYPVYLSSHKGDWYVKIKNTVKIKNAWTLLIFFTTLSFITLTDNFLQAGPPFITDDPDAIPYKHGEFYLGSIGTKSSNEFYAFLPLVEADYGAFKDTQLHIIVPLTIDKKNGQSANYGPGIIELGVKYRIIHETKSVPQIGIFPLIEAPTGDSGKGLGNGKTQVFIPLWLQKSWGKKGQEWTAFGGGGYWFNPGLNNKDYLFFGSVIQREITKYWWMGLETIYQTKAKINEHESFAFNVGGGIKLHKTLQLIYSVGNHTGLGQFLYYAALYYTW